MFKRYVWRGIPTNYAVNEKGEVMNLTNGNKLSPIVFSSGYYMIGLYITNPEKPEETGKQRLHKVPVHRMVAETFIPNPENKPEVNHKDGNKLNNSLENLEWVTHQENIHHSFYVLGHKNGPINNTDQTGENNAAAKYTNVDIMKVCELLQQNKYTVKEIAAMTGVSIGTIVSIRVGKQWQHIAKNYKIPAIQRKERLDDDGIREICEYLAEDGSTSFNEIGKMFGVDRKTVERLYHKTTRWNIAKDYDFIPRDAESRVEAICKVLSTDGETPFSVIARRFGVTSDNVGNIYNKKYYHNIVNKYTFVPRDNNKYLNKCYIREAAVACCILDIKKKKSGFRKGLKDHMDKKYFDIAYDYAKLVLR